ncbi:MAG TPA: Fe-S protein assembly co-chaperone HscB [Alphaproteobacteria bacterium]|nr:Fe-S protein assembly co-chaperone HscB [Alphaproteobacteria bacterium]
MTEEQQKGGPAADLAPCWSCHGSVDQRASFCHGCGTIQPPRPVDHFSRLGLSQSFDLDTDQVERNYFSFQRHFHPDRFATRPAREKQLSLQHATDLNEAYGILMAPLSRAESLLALKGAPLEDEGAANRDPELLMEAMEAREALAGAANSEDVEAIDAQSRRACDGCIEKISQAFADDDLEAAQRHCLRLRFLAKLGEEIRRRKGELARA